MVRMGHASSRAALIYQHAIRERDIAIAGALSAAIERVLEQPTGEVRQLALPGTDPQTTHAFTGQGRRTTSRAHTRGGTAR
jgi:hypothetical protein